MAKDVRIGFDVGGTFTDGVVLKGKEVLAKAKALTTDDVTTGIINALDILLKSKKVEVSEIGLVALGTTHTTN
ncbi:MAG: hydantoinase/oxoprolinase N-terminal domain-containing protein, partial [Thermacetogeniaceae bacterium]